MKMKAKEACVDMAMTMKAKWQHATRDQSEMWQVSMVSGFS
jgi:hypothetical protein